MSQTSLENLISMNALRNKPARVELLRQIAAALDKAHRSGNVHGNLSPRTIIVSGNPLDAAQIRVAVRDFGQPWADDAELASHQDVPEPARYMSPERILGIDPDGRSDQFSLGAIAYELVCQRRAFDAPSLSQLLYQICSADPPPADEVDPSLNRAVANALSRAGAKDREQRFSTCTAFIEALSIALEACEGWAPAPVLRPMAVAAGASAGAVAAAPPSVASTDDQQATAPVAPAVAAYDLPSTRRPRFYRDEDDDASPEATRPIPAESRGRKWLIIAAVAGLIVGAILFFAYSRQPELPVQVAETNGAPTTPPPPDASGAIKKAQPAPAKPAAEGRTAVTPEERSRKATSTEPTKIAEPVLSTVEFLTDPPGATITADNNASKTCTTPCTLPLRTGRHTLTARMDGYSEAQRIFNLPQDSSMFIQMVKQTGTLVVTSVPSGSTILVDGRDYGVTPASLRLPPGRHELALLYGSQRHVESVQVQADGIQAKSFTW